MIAGILNAAVVVGSFFNEDFLQSPSDKLPGCPLAGNVCLSVESGFLWAFSNSLLGPFRPRSFPS